MNTKLSINVIVVAFVKNRIELIENLKAIWSSYPYES